MKLIMIGLACMLAGCCSSEMVNQTEARQLVIEQMNTDEVFAIPERRNGFVVKVHDQIWFVETGVNSDCKVIIRAKTKAFDEIK